MDNGENADNKPPDAASEEAVLVDRPPTLEEVAPQERPRRSATPLPVSAANDTPMTTQKLMRVIVRKIEDGIRVTLAPLRKQVADIAALNKWREYFHRLLDPTA